MELHELFYLDYTGLSLSTFPIIKGGDSSIHFTKKSLHEHMSKADKISISLQDVQVAKILIFTYIKKYIRGVYWNLVHFSNTGKDTLTYQIILYIVVEVCINYYIGFLLLFYNSSLAETIINVQWKCKKNPIYILYLLKLFDRLKM